MFGVHLTLIPEKLSEVVDLRRENRITCPKGVKISEEYLWDRKFLIILVEATDQEAVKKFANQFSKLATEMEIGSVSTLKTLAELKP